MKQRVTRRTSHLPRNTAVIKGYVTPEIESAFRKACTAIGSSCSDVIREYAISKIEANHKPAVAPIHRPKHTPVKAQYFPGHRQSFGVIPRMRITV